MNESKAQHFFNFLHSSIAAGENILNQITAAAEDLSLHRYFSQAELAQVAGVTPTAISKAVKSGRIAPPVEYDKNKKGFPLRDLRSILGQFNAQRGRRDGDEPVTLSFASLKGGSWKTTNAFQFTAYLNSLGYRVLVADLDPQASLTKLMGKQPDIMTTDEQTAGCYLTAPDEYPASEFADAVIQKTRMPYVDLIGSCSAMHTTETILTRDVVEARMRDDTDEILKTFYRLRHLLNQVKHNYDIVILDGTPSLGMLPMNIVYACDVNVIPTPTSANDFASTVTYLKLLRDYTTSVLDIDTFNLPLPDIHAIPTKYNPNTNTTISSKMWLDFIRAMFGAKCNSHVIQRHDAVIDNCSTAHTSIFETNKGDLGLSPSSRKRAMDNYASAFDEVLKDCVFPLWPSHNIDM